MRSREAVSAMVDLQCLEMGIFPLSMPDQSSFKGMPPDELRISRRKYRKLRRKLKKKLHRNPSIYDIRHYLREKVWSQLLNA